MNHASDTASASVRSSALDAITLILHNPVSLPVLRPLLSKLGNLIHDRVEQVRAACVRMLLQIKKIPGIKYYHVIPVDHLTARLAAEGRANNPTNTVSALLTGLMINSYIPQSSTEENQQLNRTITFVKSHPEAATVFYQNVSKYLSSTEVEKLAVLLFRYVKNAKKNESPKFTGQDATNRETKRRRPAKANNNDMDTTDLQSSWSTVANVANIICILLQSSDLNDGNYNASDILRKEFTATNLISTIAHYEEQARDQNMSDCVKETCYQISSSILQFAATLPAQTVTQLVPHVIANMQSLVSTERRHSESLNSIENGEKDDVASMGTISAHVALLCVSGRMDDVARSIASSIEISFEVEHEILFASPAIDSRKRKSGKRADVIAASAGDGIVLPSLPGTIALKLLTNTLSGINPSSITVRKSLLTSTDAMHAIENALSRGIRHAEKILAADTVRTFSFTFLFYL
jgi:hypothetical protein